MLVSLTSVFMKVVVLFLTFVLFLSTFVVAQEDIVELPAPYEISYDRVVVSNGDVLSGNFISSDKNGVFLEYGFQEKIKIFIPLTEVVSLEIPKKVFVALTDGQVLMGSIKSEKEGLFLVSAEDGLKKKINLSEVKSVTRDDPNQAKEPQKWHGKVFLGFNRQTGNTESMNLSVSLEGQLETDISSAIMKFKWAEGSVDDELTQKNGYALLKYKYWPYLKENSFFIFVLDTQDYDRLQELKLRSRLGGGVGYRCYKNDKNVVDCEVGMAYTNEDLMEPNEDRTFSSARAAVYINYLFWKIINIENRFEFYPGLKDGDDFFIRNEVDVSTPLTKNWDLDLNILTTHDNVPAREEVKRTDVWTSFGIMRKF